MVCELKYTWTYYSNRASLSSLNAESYLSRSIREATEFAKYVTYKYITRGAAKRHDTNSNRSPH